MRWLAPLLAMLTLASGGWAGTTGAAKAVLTRSELASLPGWQAEDFPAALASFRNSCRNGELRPIAKYHVTEAGRNVTLAVTTADWRGLCARAGALKGAEARRFFEQNFIAAGRGSGNNLLLTGYYLPLVKASRKEDATYRYPLYSLPPEAKKASAAKPSMARAEIEAGGLKGRGLEILWLADPVMRFFLQVQGSGHAILPDGSRIQINYAGKNQQPYTAIGKLLVEEGALKKDEVSLQTIRAWLEAHPERQGELMNKNASYVFFSLQEKPSPVKGAAGVPLIAGRSVAVDPAAYSYGTPLFIAPEAGTPAPRIVMAADTGSAIIGPGRADLYCGEGEEAEAMAGPLKAPGTISLLLPRSAYGRALHDR